MMKNHILSVCKMLAQKEYKRSTVPVHWSTGNPVTSLVQCRHYIRQRLSVTFI